VTGAPSTHLLRALAPPSAPAGRSGPTRAAEPHFAELLSRAKEGSLETGLPVAVAEGSGLELSADQLERLSKVVDRAHGAGATRLVVMMDGMTLDVDVLSRRVLGRADLDDGRVLTGVDGIVRIEGTGAVTGVPLPPPGAGALAPSLGRLLADADDAKVR